MLLRRFLPVTARTDVVNNAVASHVCERDVHTRLCNLY